MNAKSKRGGARPGSGRPAKNYVVLNTRVRRQAIECLNEIKALTGQPYSDIVGDSICWYRLHLWQVQEFRERAQE